MTPAEEVLAWLEEFVIAHSLCPFAAKPWREGRVGASDMVRDDLEGVFYAALTQVQKLVEKEPGALETELLVFPRHLDDFEEFLNFVYTFEAALDESGASELVQLAHFHPQYVFADVPADDPGNLTNRSPYPVIQLLRVDSVAAAVAAYPDVEAIPDRNIAKMHELFGRK